jgi:hypothetical protein
MSTVFKCNFCDRKIEVKHFDDPQIICACGAKYTKTVTVTITGT